MSCNRVGALLLAVGVMSGCQHLQGGTPITDAGPTRFSQNANAIDYGSAGVVPDDDDIVSGLQGQAGSQMHFRLSRAYCDKRSSSQQSAEDQANFYCVPDAVTIDDTHPPESTPNKDFLIVPYKYGMNMDYPGGLELNSAFLGVHPNHTHCSNSAWIMEGSCQAGGHLWAEDNDDLGGVFSSAYSVLDNGSIDRSRSFVLIAGDTYSHTSHGDMLFALRDTGDNFRFQFGPAGSNGADDPASYKYYTRARIDGTGKGFFDGGTQVGGADFAESVGATGLRSNYDPGDVLVIDTNADRRFSLSDKPYSTLVAGIYSTKPGILGSAHGSEEPKLATEIPMAVTGIVPCKVSAENGPISRGDLLVTSSTPGYAMRGTDRAKLPGAIIGKALQPLQASKGRIEVLMTLR